jgi:SAM-dependent methyltransferase
VAEVTAADASIGMIAEVTRKKIALANAKDAARLSTLHLDLLETAPLSLKFDLIIASLVLHIVDDANRVLDAFRSMLANGGWVVILDWAGPATTTSFQPVPSVKHRTSDEWANALARAFFPKRIRCRIIHHFEREDGTLRPVFLLAAGPVPPPPA